MNAGNEDVLSSVKPAPMKPACANIPNGNTDTSKRAVRITELECCTISTSFSLRCSDKCSVRNDFAIITEAGVHILSLRPYLWNRQQHPSEKYAIHRALIPTPTKFPVDDLPLDYQKLDREKFCLLYLNPKLRPKAERLEVPLQRVKQMDWGYLTSPYKYRSILGVLSNHGCLELYFFDRFKWTLFADISDMWKQYCLKTWFGAGDDDFDSFLTAYKRIRITTFAWCNGVKLKNENDALLLCVSESGMLSLWTISEDVDSKPPELIKTHDLGPNLHTCLWYTTTNDEQAFLVSGFTDGTVAMNVCSIDRDSSVITFKGDLTLWKEEDLVIAENMKIKVDNEKAMLVLSKEQWLLIFNLDDEVTVQQFSFDKRIAGLEIMDDFSVFVTLLNFACYLVKPSKGEKEIIQVNLSTNIKNHRCSGISFSKNKEFCLFSANIAKFHDHLTFKEPWYLLLCSVNNQLSLEKLLETVIRTSVHESADYIENFRIHSIKNGFEVDQNALLSAWSFLKHEDPRVWRKTLQLMYILMSGCKLNQNSDDIHLVEMALSMCNFQFYDTEERIARNKDETHFYCMWLRANRHRLREPIKDHQLYQNIPIDLEKDELIKCDNKCEVCSSNFINHSPTDYVVCEKEHKILRCRYSFLPIFSQPHTECSCCHAVIIQKAGFRRCIMCDSEL